LSSVLALALGTLAFLLIASVVQTGGTREIDERVLKAVRDLTLRNEAIGGVWAEESVVAITSLGSVAILTGLSASVVGLLFLTQRSHAAVLIMIALLGALGLNLSLKTLFGRERPDVVPRLQRVNTKSFPSGHALIATAAYCTLGAVAANLLRERRLKLYVMSIAVMVSILVGLSRVYLGVHYPSDVLAGWTVGFLWALLCWVTARYLQRRGVLEQPR
jgi:undecaprenyl-diphosphatase